MIHNRGCASAKRTKLLNRTMSHTYYEIASNWNLWAKYIGICGDEWAETTVSERIGYLWDHFGPEKGGAL